MTVNDFLDMLLIEEILVDVFNFDTGNVVFTGTVDSVRDRYGGYEFDCFDVDDGRLCINLTILEDE